MPRLTIHDDEIDRKIAELEEAIYAKIKELGAKVDGRKVNGEYITVSVNNTRAGRLTGVERLFVSVGDYGNRKRFQSKKGKVDVEAVAKYVIEKARLITQGNLAYEERDRKIENNEQAIRRIKESYAIDTVDYPVSLESREWGVEVKLYCNSAASLDKLVKILHDNGIGFFPKTKE